MFGELGGDELLIAGEMPVDVSDGIGRQERPKSFSRFPEQLLDGRLHGFRPDAVAGDVWVQAVGHEFLIDGAVLVEENVTDIEPEDSLIIHVGLENPVDLKVAETPCVLGCVPAREDGHEQDLRFRELGMDFLEQGEDAVGRIVTMELGDAAVVRAHHHQHNLGVPVLHAGEAAVLEMPEHVLGLVSAGSDVDRFALPIEFVPHRFADASPAEDDGVPDHQEIDLLLRDPLAAVLVMLHPLSPAFFDTFLRSGCRHGGRNRLLISGVFPRHFLPGGCLGFGTGGLMERNAECCHTQAGENGFIHDVEGVGAVG